MVDALKGYHHVQFDEESSALTTFSAPFGRRQYVRLPMRVTHAGDDFGHRISDVFYELPCSRRVVENVLIYSAIYEEHVKVIHDLFPRANKRTVSLNTKKIVFGQSSVIFGGFIIDAEGFRPDPTLLRVG